VAILFVLALVGSAQAQSTLFTASQVPTRADVNDTSAVELGVKFRSDSAGYITGLRFYKASTNTGTHVGNIWSTSGALLGSATFTNETASGWQQVTFSSPIPVSANTTYIASYFAPVGHYSADNNYFATTGVDKAPLHAPADGTYGGNGVYSYSSTSSFPSNSYQASNYWVDVVFQTSINSGSGTGSSGSQSTIFTSSSTPSQIDSNDGAPVELGMKFKSDSAGSITGVRFYKAAMNTGTHVAHLWSTTGTLLGSATFTNETSSGWQQVNFSTPISISANTVYIVSYFAPKGHYSDNTGYFSKSGADRAPLHALQDGTSGPNGVYLYASSGGFPNNSYSATNYWVDPVFQANGGSTGTPQLSASTGSMSFGNVSVNTSSTLSLSLTSSGTAPVTVNSASISGTGFSLVAGTFPVTLSQGQSLTLQVSFKPTSATSSSGAVTIASNSATNSTITVALSGTGVSNSPQLTLGSSSLAFGSIAVNSSTTKSLTLSSSGTAALTISSASISGAGFSLVGGSFPITLNAGQSTTLTVQFKPSSSGAASGALTIASNSVSGSTSTVALSGTGASVAHSVNLTWQAPSSSSTVIAGYNVYRMVNGGTSYVLLNSSSIAGTAFSDSGVSSGTTYLYYVTSVDQNKTESTPSATTTVSIP
jgi:hypothetical protein